MVDELLKFGVREATQDYRERPVKDPFLVPFVLECRFCNTRFEIESLSFCLTPFHSQNARSLISSGVQGPEQENLA